MRGVGDFPDALSGSRRIRDVRKIPAAAVILAGGRSRRMGRDKAALRVSGERLVDRSARSLRPLFPEVYVAVGSRRWRPPAGTRAVRDRFPGAGPLAGIHAALSAARRPYLFVFACDMPFLSPALVRFLWGRSRGARGAVPEGPRGLEPLCAFYRKDLTDEIARRLSNGRGAAVHALAALPGVRRVGRSAVRRADPEGLSFLNLNRPRDLARLAGEGKAPYSGRRKGGGWMGSLIKKRRKKMNKHKYKKMRKRLAFLRK